MTGTSTVTVTASSARDEPGVKLRIARIWVCMLALFVAGCLAQTDERPAEAPTTVIYDTKEDDSSLDLKDVQEPPVPYVGGSDAEFPLQDEPTEIDCIDAEELCDTGTFACDDITDHCDIGPDGSGELPDEYDWDAG
jgi:hypothetical protein